MTPLIPLDWQVYTGPEHQPFALEGAGWGAALLVHGFPGTPAEMRALARVLNARGWAAYGPLLPGFGPELALLGEKSYADWLRAVQVEAANLRQQYARVVLIGNSMGGALCLKVAQQHPPDALVLVSPFTQLEHWAWNALPVLKVAFPSFKPFQMMRVDFADADTRRAIQAMMPELDLSNPAVQAQMINFAVPTNLLDQIRQAGLQGFEAAAQVGAPTLIVQGDRDDLVRPATTQRLAARLPGPVTYVELPAAHNPLQEHGGYWGTLIQAVETFLQPLEPKTTP